MNDNRLDHVPGSNKYDPCMPDRTSKNNKRPTWSCGKDARFKNYSKPTPGPGSYNIPSKGTEGFKFTTRCKPGINAELAGSKGITATPYKMRTKPGPGNYDPPVDGAWKKLSYSMNGINEKWVKGTDRNFTIPGPGNYDDCITQHYKSIPGSKIHKDARLSYFLKTSISGNPDPGNYEKKGFEKLNYYPKYSFGKEQRDVPLPRGPPGPDAYDYINQVGNHNDCHMTNTKQIELSKTFTKTRSAGAL